MMFESLPIGRAVPFAPHGFSVLLLLVLTCSELALAAPVPATPSAACGCVDPYRKYTRQPTADVEALFRAAAEVDEVRFTELIAKVPDIAEYAVKGRPLLDVLLSPSVKLISPKESWAEWWNYPEAQKRQITARYVATLPAKTRMLALALEHGAGVRDVAYYARRPPLSAAVAWGTPEMVGLLLSHGADVNQVGDSGHTALEEALDPEFSRNAGFRPSFVTPEERSVMVGMLIKAGAARPYKSIDDASGDKRPAADYLIWPAAAAMTRGEEVMRQLSALGTRPADNEGKDQSLAMAARTGNLGGLRWLKQQLPRVSQVRRWHDGGWKKEPLDLWLQAASWALYPHTRFGAPGASRDAVLKALIVRDMPWLQTNELSSRAWDKMEPDAISLPQAGDTLLHHLVHAGAEDWVRRVVGMGAPVDGAPDDSKTPLVQAIQDGNVPMVRLLLSLGANPLGHNLKKSPLSEILVPGPNWLDSTAEEKDRQLKSRREMLALVLAGLTPEQKVLLAQPANSPFDVLLGYYRGPDGDMLRMLLATGLPVPPQHGDVIAPLLRSSDTALVNALLDHGLRVTEREGQGTPVLVNALGDRALMARLLAAGADPNLPDRDGRSPVAWAVRRGEVEALDLLLANGGRLDGALKGQPLSALHELAVRSKSDAMLARLELKHASFAPMCFAGEWDLIDIVLDSSDPYWSRLLKQGFGKATGAGCPKRSSSERLVDALLADKDGYAAGWSGERLSKRLAELARRAPIAPQSGRASMAAAVAAGRQDVVHALRGVGFAVPAPARRTADLAAVTPAERGPMRKLAGNYYLRGVREVGSQIRLNADGSFSFMLAYGAVDQAASGQWRLQGNTVQFQTPVSVEAPDWQPFRRVAATSSPNAAPADRLRIKVQYGERSIDDVTVTAFGCQVPQWDSGRTGDGLWEGRIDGALCQIVLRHPNIQHGVPYVYQLSPAERSAKARDFVFEATPGRQDVAQPFNVRMKYQRGALLWQNEGRDWEYRKE